MHVVDDCDGCDGPNLYVLAAIRCCPQWHLYGLKAPLSLIEPQPARSRVEVAQLGAWEQRSCGLGQLGGDFRSGAESQFSLLQIVNVAKKAVMEEFLICRPLQPGVCRWHYLEL